MRRGRKAVLAVTWLGARNHRGIGGHLLMFSFVNVKDEVGEDVELFLEKGELELQHRGISGSS